MSDNSKSIYDAAAESIRRYREALSYCPHVGKERFCECFGYATLGEIMEPILDAAGPEAVTATAPARR